MGILTEEFAGFPTWPAPVLGAVVMKMLTIRSEYVNELMQKLQNVATARHGDFMK